MSMLPKKVTETIKTENSQMVTIWTPKARMALVVQIQVTATT